MATNSSITMPAIWLHERIAILSTSLCLGPPEPAVSDTIARPEVLKVRNVIMPDLNDGETIEMKGSGSKPYVLKNVGGVYSCTCPAWRNQSQPIERRTCKHLRKLRGDAAEESRLGGAVTVRAKATAEGGAKEGPPL